LTISVQRTNCFFPYGPTHSRVGGIGIGTAGCVKGALGVEVGVSSSSMLKGPSDVRKERVSAELSLKTDEG
jgi:hypothetical protein